jgi:hypothetical protein
MQTKRSSLRSSSTQLPDSPPSRSDIPPASTREAQSTPTPSSPHSQPFRTAETTTLVPTSITTLPQHETGNVFDTLSHPSDPPSTPVPCSSKSVNSVLSAVRPLAVRPPLPGAYLSPSIETPTHRPIPSPQTPQTEPRAVAMHNPYYRSMAPPPSPNLPPAPTPQPQPPDSASGITSRQPSTTISTTASAPVLPVFREEVDAAIAVAERKLSGRLVKRVFSRKSARPHIYQSAVRPSTLFLRRIFTVHIA